MLFQDKILLTDMCPLMKPHLLHYLPAVLLKWPEKFRIWRLFVLITTLSGHAVFYPN